MQYKLLQLYQRQIWESWLPVTIHQWYREWLSQVNERFRRLEYHSTKFIGRSRQDLICKKGVLRNFAKFTEKHLCQRLFFNKVAGQKGLCHSCFPVNLAKFLRIPFIIEHLWWLLLFIRRNSIRKFQFTDNIFKVSIKWISKKLIKIFQLKNKNMYPICNEDYIFETEYNEIARWSKHNNLKHDSKLAQHLKNDSNRSFNWFVVANASSN